jgi:hypothetical protein
MLSVLATLKDWFIDGSSMAFFGSADDAQKAAIIQNVQLVIDFESKSSRFLQKQQSIAVFHGSSHHYG